MTDPAVPSPLTAIVTTIWPPASTVVADSDRVALWPSASATDVPSVPAVPQAAARAATIASSAKALLSKI